MSYKILQYFVKWFYLNALNTFPKSTRWSTCFKWKQRYDFCPNGALLGRQCGGDKQDEYFLLFVSPDVTILIIAPEIFCPFWAFHTELARDLRRNICRMEQRKEDDRWKLLFPLREVLREGGGTCIYVCTYTEDWNQGETAIHRLREENEEWKEETLFEIFAFISIVKVQAIQTGTFP